MTDPDHTDIEHRGSEAATAASGAESRSAGANGANENGSAANGNGSATGNGPATAHHAGNGAPAGAAVSSVELEEALRSMGAARPRRIRRLRLGERDFLLDAVALGLATVSAAVTARIAGTPIEGLGWMLVFPILTLVLLAGRGIYRPRAGIHILEEVRTVVEAAAVAAMTVAFVRVLLNADVDAASEAVRGWLFAVIYLVAIRAIVDFSDERGRLRQSHGRRTLIIGAGRVGHLLAGRLLQRPQTGLRPIGFVDDDPLSTKETEECPVLGPIWQLEPLVLANRVEHAILSFSRAPLADELAVSRRLQRLGVSVSVVPRLFEDIPDRMSVERVGGLPLLTIYPSQPRSWQFKVKYALDRVIAAVALLVASPVLIAAALGVLLTMGRPILFRQRRVGLDGREFDMLKFRSMRPAAEEGNRSMAELEEAIGHGLAPGGVEGDDRRTRFGSFLRVTCLDELPQFINVVRGDMAIVGPRPERDHIAARFRESVYRYEDRDRVKSGITGWAQVHGLRGQTSLADRVEWDNYYIENWSLWLDFKILLMTVVAVCRDRFD
jgi:exopolysaccharide biosynthesis polyprenyl glycosylphosphotransferase